MTALIGAIDRDAAQTVVRITGDLDIASGPDAVALAEVAISNPEARTLVLDLSGVDFMDSCGISALVRVRNLCIDHGAELHLRAVTPNVRNVLTITALTEAFGLSDADSDRG